VPPIWNNSAIGNVDLASADEVFLAMEKMIRLNREDLLGSIQAMMSQNSISHGRPRWSCPSDAIMSSGDVPHIWKAVQPYHRTPPGMITIHRHSAVSFMRGSTGHVFTGLVNIHELVANTQEQDKSAKIFLFPLNPEGIQRPQPGEAERRVHRGGREFADGVSTRVCRHTKPGTIMHGGPGAASHSQLLELIQMKKKHEALNQANGDFIGFTVHKGMPDSGQYPNRYRFISQSSNAPSFRPVQQPAAGSSNKQATKGVLTSLMTARAAVPKQATSAQANPPVSDPVESERMMSVTQPWGFAIKKSVDFLLKFQVQARRTYAGNYDQFLAWLDGDDQSAKAYWDRSYAVGSLNSRQARSCGESGRRTVMSQPVAI